jgi:hypothetical protein
MDMKRLITFACGLALVGACNATPSVQGSATGNALVSKPVATTGTPSTQSAPAASPAEAVPASTATAAGTPAMADPTPSNPIARVADRIAAYRNVTLPAGTVLPVDLETAVGSDTSKVEQPVSGRLRRAVSVGGAEVLPAGTLVSGHVTAAQRPGKVKGRGLIAMRFTQLDTPGEGRSAIRTATVSRLAPATKQKDAVKIGAPAVAGAVIGGILGGKGGAGKGAVIGGGAGTGYVLATRGEEIHLAKGADLAVKLTAPVTFRVKQ